MAVQKIYVDYNFNKNELLNAKLHPVSTTERTALASTLNSNDKGLIVYDKDVTIFYVWDGNNFKPIGLTDAQYAILNESYNRSVVDIDITSTTTNRSVKLTYRDNTFISDNFNFAYIHDQSVPASSWSITHNLNKYPSVTIVDTANSEIIGEVVYNNTNTLTLTFSASFSGKAFLN
jgi:hypothetical protein